MPVGPCGMVCIAALEREGRPLTTEELRQFTGHANRDLVQRVMKKLHKRGIAYIKEWRPMLGGTEAAWWTGDEENAPRTKRESASEASKLARKRAKQRLGVDVFRSINQARKKGADCCIVDGVMVWKRGVGSVKLTGKQNEKA